MSKITFITSEKELQLNKFGIELIKPNDYLLEHYPCLKGKKFIYNFEQFDHSVSYKDLIKCLIKHVNKDNIVILLVLEQTDNVDEINTYNNDIQNKIVINLAENNDKIYDLIYKLEREALQSSSEYKLINE